MFHLGKAAFMFSRFCRGISCLMSLLCGYIVVGVCVVGRGWGCRGWIGNSAHATHTRLDLGSSVQIAPILDSKYFKQIYTDWTI